MFFIAIPRIELHPTRQIVRPGENPSILCKATGDEPLAIEWKAVGRDMPDSVTRERGFIQFHGITYSDAGKYACVASNPAGTAQAVAEVLVNGTVNSDSLLNSVLTSFFMFKT